MQHSFSGTKPFAAKRLGARGPDYSFGHLRGLTALGALFVALLIAGCDVQGQAAPTPTATVPPTATAVPTATQPAAPPTRTRVPPTATATTLVVPEGQFVNPVIKSDFPDPGIIKVGDTYYAYATNSGTRNVQLATSTDLVTWKLGPDALPDPGKWASLEFGNIWAPEVIDIAGHFVMYYTAHDKTSNRQCIGVATSDTPEGPYKPAGDKALICQVEEGGSIDPSPLHDGDKLYLYWKNDGNCCGGITYIYVQELSPDGLSLLGEAGRLLSNDRRWEGPVIEAPTMWKQDGKYFMFFSANAYNTVNYAIGYATCESATGPCQDAAENPILKTSTKRPPVIGPGHQTIVTDDDGELWLVYHAWAVPKSGGKLEQRNVWIDRLTWEDGKPHVAGPTTAPQPVP
jgi:beta-xylosidase